MILKRALLPLGAVAILFCLPVFAGHHGETEQKNIPEKKALNVYFFGHSLVHHANYKIPTPKDHTSIPFWLKHIADAAGRGYTTDGQFGFLRNHAEFPPKPQWGFVNVESGWQQSFGASNYDAVVLTAANFIQYQGPHKAYYDDKNVSPLSATLDIVDYVQKYSPKSQFYIYENWPDMGEYAPDFPGKAPSARKLQAYYDYTKNDFHEWWLDYQDRVNKKRPQANVKMIPVGPIIAKLRSETPLQNIPFEQLYEDNAPHGRANLYFLAALVHYSALYKEPAPSNLPDFSGLHPLIKENYRALADRVWEELNEFNGSGKGRLW